MWYFVTFIVVFLITLVQTSFLEAFKYLNFIPNLLLIFFVYLLIYEKRERALVFAPILGFIMDSFSASTFGLNIAYFTILAMIIGYIRQFIGRSKDLSLALLLTFISSLVLILFDIIIMLLGRDLGWHLFFLATKELALGLVANVIGAAIFVPIFYRIYIFSKRERDLVHYE